MSRQVSRNGPIVQPKALRLPSVSRLPPGEVPVTLRALISIACRTIVPAMTATFLEVESTSRRATGSRSSATGRWFYVGMAVAAIVVCVAGFAPALVNTSARRGPMTPLVMLHAALAGAWIGLYLLQATLVATGRVGAHKTLGTASAIVAAAVVVTAWQASVETARRGYDLSGDLSAGAEWVVAQSVFAFGNAVIFGVLVCAALLLRRRPHAHKRLMTLAVIQTLMTAPLAHFNGHWKIPFPIVPIWSVGVLIVMLVHDRRSRGRIHPASLLGGLGLIVIGNVQAFVIGPSRIWQEVVVWLAS